jgi:hypothetical protein
VGSFRGVSGDRTRRAGKQSASQWCHSAESFRRKMRKGRM